MCTFFSNANLASISRDEKDNFPLAAKTLKEDFYVDDMLSGAKTFQETLILRDDLISLLAKGCCCW